MVKVTFKGMWVMSVKTKVRQACTFSNQVVISGCKSPLEVISKM